jgi:hypothetical protein
LLTPSLSLNSNQAFARSYAAVKNRKGMKLIIVAALAVLILSGLAAASCHNSTGACRKSHYVCANEELIPHAKRCDGVEDCADGTDEYLCDQPGNKPITDMSVAERQAVTEVSCVKCTCSSGSITVANGAATWWNIATKAPRDMALLTGANTYQNRPCNPAGAATGSITLNVYKKKTTKGCRGWICCFRQASCNSCTVGGSASRCYVS